MATERTSCEVGAAKARMSLHLSKYHIVENHMSRLKYMYKFRNYRPIKTCILDENSVTLRNR